ncbi:MAG: DUF4442 domain-containing protein [Paracoccaceae bacterium]
MTNPYELIRAQLSKMVPFANEVGIELGPISDGEATATLTQRPETSNHIQSIHAGAMFTLGEAASGSALAGAIAPVLLNCRPVAKDAQISFKKIAKGTLTASAKTSRPGSEILAELNTEGKIVFDVNVDIQNEQGDTVAEVKVTWHVRQNA